MIDKNWMNEFAYEVKQCPKYHQKSFCLIFEGKISGEIWECAESSCLYNPSAIQRRFK
jgi:hypothetical protein